MKLTEEDKSRMKAGFWTSFVWMMITIGLFFFLYSMTGLKKFLLDISFDIIVYLRNDVSTRTIDSLAKAISYFGEGIGLGGIFYFSACLLKIEHSFICINALNLSVIAVGVLKFVFSEGRPFFVDPRIHPSSCKTIEFGFPSGHSAGSTASFITIVYFILQERNKTRNKLIDLITYAVLAVLLLSVAFSRSFVGVHSFDQTVAGMTLGLIIAIFMTQSYIPEYLKHLRLNLMETQSVKDLTFNRFVFVFLFIFHMASNYLFMVTEGITEEQKQNILVACQFQRNPFTSKLTPSQMTLGTLAYANCGIGAYYGCIIESKFLRHRRDARIAMKARYAEDTRVNWVRAWACRAFDILIAGLPMLLILVPAMTLLKKYPFEV